MKTWIWGVLACAWTVSAGASMTQASKVAMHRTFPRSLPAGLGDRMTGSLSQDERFERGRVSPAGCVQHTDPAPRQSIGVFHTP